MNGSPSKVETIGSAAKNVRLSPGILVGGVAVNTNTEDGYLLFYDRPAAEVVVGTTPVKWWVQVYGSSQSPLCRAGEGVYFEKAISVAGMSAKDGSGLERLCDATFVIA